VELVGERMREKPQVSSLDKNVLFACCDRVMIGLVITKENYKDNQCTAELVYNICLYSDIFPVYSKDADIFP
jgi:hypothetical protein